MPEGERNGVSPDVTRGEPAASLGSPRARARVHSGRKRTEWRDKKLPYQAAEDPHQRLASPAPDGHFGRTGQDLVFFYTDGQALFKAVIGREAERHVRLVTFYESDRADMAAAEERGVIVRDLRRK